MNSSTQPIKPPALRAGDTVGIVAPASNIRRADLEAGCEALRRAGYNPVYSESIFDKDLYFAGSLDRRLGEFEEMFERDEVRAVICARGGYGANYLLPELERRKFAQKLKAQPKIFVGYSDLTALLTHFVDSVPLVTFHGPMAAKDWAHADGVDLASWQCALSSNIAWDVPINPEATALVAGQAEGILYGGCLSILVASLGTPYELKSEGTILFLEDIAAKPYQIDRMLMQLKLAGKLRGVRGLVFGEMLDCRQSTNQECTLQEVITRIVGDLGVPVGYGVRSGHVSSGNITLPFGVRARLTAGDRVALRFLEPAVDVKNL
jgi:muramoyltetrapeptide carboxypeptidase